VSVPRQEPNFADQVHVAATSLGRDFVGKRRENLAAEWLLIIIAEECGEWEIRDAYFAGVFVRLKRVYATAASTTTLDGLRTSEALREIIRKSQHEELRKQAIEVARNSPWLRDELPETPQP
jgi:hypothetical protein